MGLLLLLTSTLLFSWISLNTAVKITSVQLTIEPSDNVSRSSTVTFRCKATVLTFGKATVNPVYEIYRGDHVIHEETTSSSDEFIWQLHDVRVSNSGKYKCNISISDQEMASESATLKVTGMSTPILHLDKTNVTEGEYVTATCSAPDETGDLKYNFFKDSKDLQTWTSSNKETFILKDVGKHIIECSYIVSIMPDLYQSDQSNAVTVTVKELSLTPVLKISPQDNIYEGDTLNITCSVNSSFKDYPGVELFLSQGTELIKRGNTFLHVSWTTPSGAPELTIKCSIFVNTVEKRDNKTLSVNELFSVPTLRMSPLEVFQGDSIQLICSSKTFSHNRREIEPVYSLKPSDHYMTIQQNGVFIGNAKTTDFNYTCTASAKGINKTSNVLTIGPKVPVSAPDIKVSGNAILRKNAEILCQSETGTPPINYTLWRAKEKKQMAIVQEFSKPANFTVFISEPGELDEYVCSASNGDREPRYSAKLHAAVIEPMTEAHLMVVPISGDISEGNSITLICSFRGTPPVTVWWFREGHSKPLQDTTTNINTTDYPFTLSKEHSDKYYCKAENRASSVESNRVDLVVGMAMWKKLLIPGIIILGVSSLVMVGFVLFIRSRRGRVDRTPESVWSTRKPEPETDNEISTVSNEPEVEYTEVVHPRSADSTRNPLRKGTDTVYTELQNSQNGAADYHDFDSVRYVDHNGEQQTGFNCHNSEAKNYSDLPTPVD
ncbi:PREDICTED: platelet endothelial cell adhesion molecule-like isoform X2 [Cyprinodon variegatus]|uniref:platelet endothelial cell adhesion molecule-like isoform X2 n=1 Tax=Cyprinodon variegatus TaxID=28743 RepID=UPI0007428E29|nr:PREDICTED: platelet endothelial cell adhesion molecule-like isoform X2 [Cyprinodon variegatus]